MEPRLGQVSQVSAASHTPLAATLPNRPDAVKQDTALTSARTCPQRAIYDANGIANTVTCAVIACSCVARSNSSVSASCLR